MTPFGERDVVGIRFSADELLAMTSKVALTPMPVSPVARPMLAKVCSILPFSMSL
jgi:hypothetical protein